MEKIRIGFQMANRWSDPPIIIMGVIALVGPVNLILSLLLGFFVHFLTIPLPSILLWVYYNFIYLRTPPANTSKWIKFRDGGLRKAFSDRQIPICILYEAYIREELDFVEDVYETLLHRDEFICYRPTWCLFKFLVEQALPGKSSSFHAKSDDAKQISLHYDRGNDFFASFLGPSMIYTSGIFYGLHQNLEQAQENKCSTVCDKLQVKPGETYLDIGCGWGTLARHAVTKYKAKATGVTLSKEGAAWCREQNAKAGLSSENIEILNIDYRELASRNVKFDNISSIEMAEHVGLKNFPSYLGLVKDILSDDGMFLMQVSGLRKGSNWQDVQWGLFMSKYIFPGADASTPLNWYVDQMESAGFEVRSVETIGRHYSHTIHHWYKNWLKNRETMQPKYGENLYRLWAIFLAWSVIASGQGSATCYQLLAHKNTYEFNRDIFCEKSQCLKQ